MIKFYLFVNYSIMKNNLTINEIKEKIANVKGKNIQMLVNKGRKKVERLEGVIQNLYPSVFTVQIEDENLGKNLVTYSYTEVLCGFVKFVENKKN